MRANVHTSATSLHNITAGLHGIGKVPVKRANQSALQTLGQSTVLAAPRSPADSLELRRKLLQEVGQSNATALKQAILS